MSKKLTIIGVLISFAILILAGFIFYTNTEKLKLNEIGDFIAGFASPIALLWLVLGFLQQGEELRLNTQALKDQQVELHQQKEALEWLAIHAKRVADKR